MNKDAVWYCKIGFANRESLPTGADSPLRKAVQKAYRDLTGEDEEFCFSGWGAELTEHEANAIEHQMNQGQ